MLIGPAERQDLPTLAALYQDAFPEALQAVFGKPRLPAPVVEDFFQLIYAYEPDGFCVARNDREILGFMIVVSDFGSFKKDLIWSGNILKIKLDFLMGRYAGIGWRFIPRLLKTWWNYREVQTQPTSPRTFAQVLAIVVAPAWRRQGIGRALSEKALGYLRGKGVRQVRLEVHAEKHEAVSLYRKMGFVEAGRLTSPRGPALVMMLDLGPER